MTYRVAITEDFPARTARLRMIRSFGNVDEYLMADGTWVSTGAGATPETPDGILLPLDALEDIYTALAKYLGNSVPSQAAVDAMRESLEVERRRVDAVLAMVSTPVDTGEMATPTDPTNPGPPLTPLGIIPKKSCVGG